MSAFPRKAEFLEWLEHPVTKVVRDMLEAERDIIRKQWESGAFGDYTQEGTVITNMSNVGYCRGLALVAELDYTALATKMDVTLTEEEMKEE